MPFFIAKTILFTVLCHYDGVVATLYHSDIKIHEANMGPIWGRQDPGGPHVGPMNFAIWVEMWACGLL